MRPRGRRRQRVLAISLSCLALAISLSCLARVSHADGAPAGESARPAPAPEFSSPAPTDTARILLELGASTELSNEVFYEGDVDTTFLSPRLVDSPESQVSAVSRVAWEGTRAHRRVGYRIQNDASIGGLTQSDVLEMRAQTSRTGPRRLDLLSRLAYRHDRSFGRDLTEGRAEGFGRLRHELGDDQTLAELGGRWDFGRSRGSSAAYLPNRNAGGAWIALDRLPLSGAEWRAGYSFTARAYPDSIERDHLEHGWEAHLRQPLPGLASLELETMGQRRVTIHTPLDSRDLFVNADAAAEIRWRPLERLETRTRFDAEWFRYDEPDSVLYFDYQVMRASLMARLENVLPMTVSIGSRLQWLRSPREAAESYDEAAGAVELEWLGPGQWWNLGPTVGWRNYLAQPTGNPFEDVGIHSSYWFLDLSVFAEQALGAGWHLRGTGWAHDEHHRDTSQNARSLYFSLDIRRLF